MSYSLPKYFFSFFFISIFLFGVSSIGLSQSSKLDSLLNVIEAQKNCKPKCLADTMMVKTFNLVSSEYYEIGSMNAAQQYGENALQLAKKINYRRGIADAYIRIANCYLNAANYPECLARVYASLKIREEMHDKKGIANSYVGIGKIQFQINNYEEALKNFNIALKLQMKMNDHDDLDDTYDAIAGVYKNQEKYDEALRYYLESIKIEKETGDDYGLAYEYHNIGSLYDRLKNYATALEYYNMALQSKEKTGDIRGASATLINISLVLIETNKFKEAKINLLKALDLAKQTDSKFNIYSIYQCLSDLGEIQKDYTAACTNLKFADAYKDTLENEENVRKQTQVEMQFVYDKRSATDSIKNAEKAKFENSKHEHEVSKQKTYALGGIIGFILMLIVAIVSFRAFKQKQNANKIISEQKLIVEEKQKEVMDSIHYARRIQQAILPTAKYIDKNLKRLKNL